MYNYRKLNYHDKNYLTNNVYGLLKNPLTFIEKIKNKTTSDDYLKYATFIRKLRTMNKLTIADLSKDICSISYLSKLENGLLQANNSTINLLFERLGVDFDTFSKQNEKIDLHEVVFYYAEGDIKALEKKKEEADLIPLNILVPIVRGFYYLAINRLDLVKQEIINIDPVKETLSQEDALIFLFIVIEYYVKISYHKIAYNYLKLSDELPTTDPILKLLFLENKIKVGYNLSSNVLLVNAYREFLVTKTPTYPVMRTIEVNYLYNLAIFNDFPNDVLNNTNHLFTHKLKEEEKILNFYYENLIKLKTKPALDIYKNLIEHKDYLKNGKILALLSYVVFILDKAEYYHALTFFTKDYNFDAIDYVHQKFVCFVLMYGSRTNDSELLQFMKDEIMPEIDNEICLIYNDIYEVVYINLLASFSRYKEIYLFFRDHNFYKASFNG